MKRFFSHVLCSVVLFFGFLCPLYGQDGTGSVSPKMYTNTVKLCNAFNAAAGFTTCPFLGITTPWNELSSLLPANSAAGDRAYCTYNNSPSVIRGCGTTPAYSSGGVEHTTLFLFKFVGSCPAAYEVDAITGECEIVEDLSCDVEEALTGLFPTTGMETFLKPEIIDIGEIVEYQCLSNCEVKYTSTLAVVSETPTDVTVEYNESYVVSADNCDDLPPNTNTTEPTVFVEGEDENPDDIDDVDDPPGPDDVDDADPPPTDDPPPPPPPPGDFCTLYPTHPSCTPSEGAVCGGPGLPPCNVKLYNNTGTSSAFCTTMPSYTGDRLLGAMLIQQWRTMCASEKAGREIEQEIKKGTLDVVAGLQGIEDVLTGDPGETVLETDFGTVPDYQQVLDDANAQRVLDIGAAGTGEFEFTANFNPFTTLMENIIPQPGSCGVVAMNFGVDMDVNTCLLAEFRQAAGWGLYALTVWGIFLIATRKREV